MKNWALWPKDGELAPTPVLDSSNHKDTAFHPNLLSSKQMLFFCYLSLVTESKTDLPTCMHPHLTW